MRHLLLNNVYHHSSLKSNSTILKKKKKLLVVCTTHVPFKDHLGNIYTQTEGVLYFLTSIWTILKISNKLNKPTIYERYIDDIKQLITFTELKDNFEKKKLLKFTFEFDINKKKRSLCSMYLMIINFPIHSFKKII